MDTVNLAADKFSDDMGARMTEFAINPAKGTAEMRRVSLRSGNLLAHPHYIVYFVDCRISWSDGFLGLTLRSCLI